MTSSLVSKLSTTLISTSCNLCKFFLLLGLLPTPSQPPLLSSLSLPSPPSPRPKTSLLPSPNTFSLSSSSYVALRPSPPQSLPSSLATSNLTRYSYDRVRFSTATTPEHSLSSTPPLYKWPPQSLQSSPQPFAAPPVASASFSFFLASLDTHSTTTIVVALLVVSSVPTTQNLPPPLPEHLLPLLTTICSPTAITTSMLLPLTSGHNLSTSTHTLKPSTALR